MEAFVYLSILTSLVLGPGITRILTRFGRLLQVWHKSRLYWVHVLWAVNLFLYIVLNWWILFRWSTVSEWNFFIFLFVLLSPTIAFLMSVLLVPDPLEGGMDLKHHFYANHRSFLILAALLPPIDALDTLLKGWDHFVAQGAIYIITLLVLLVTCLVAAYTRDERYHAFFAVFFLVYITVFIGINLSVLG